MHCSFGEEDFWSLTYFYQFFCTLGVRASQPHGVSNCRKLHLDSKSCMLRPSTLVRRTSMPSVYRYVRLPSPSLKQIPGRTLIACNAFVKGHQRAHGGKNMVMWDRLISLRWSVINFVWVSNRSQLVREWSIEFLHTTSRTITSLSRVAFDVGSSKQTNKWKGIPFRGVVLC